MIRHKVDEHTVGLHTIVYRWTDVIQDAPIEPVALRGGVPLSLQVIGNFASATASTIGSNDGKHWDVLPDALGLGQELRKPGIISIVTRSQHIAPCFRGGSVETKLTFLLLVEMPR